MAVEARSDYFESLKSCLVQQRTSFKKTHAALETRLDESEVRPEAELTERATQRDRLRIEVDCLSLD